VPISTSSRQSSASPWTSGSGGEVECLLRCLQNGRVVLADQFARVRRQEPGPHRRGQFALQQAAQAVDDGPVHRAVRTGLPGGRLCPRGECGDHQVVAAQGLCVLHGFTACLTGGFDGSRPDLRAQQPAEQFDAFVRSGRVGDGVGEEVGRHVVGVAGLGKLGGLDAVADGLR
jgi:hypothetical protein